MTAAPAASAAPLPWLAGALEAIDRANATDPRPEPLAQREGELAQRWVLALCPTASPALVLAARAHHLARWAIPRSEYPEGRAGYHRWRVALRAVQAEAVGAVLAPFAAGGLSTDMVAHVKALVRKEGLGVDPDAQVLEDAVCLAFLETQADSLAARLDDETMINALRKSLAKMSEAGRTAAGDVPLTERCQALAARALHR